ncbi:MAG: GDP-mannose 4,6-dehydratase, partial [Desulfobacterales bacterium]|nr:GDP-mannose 4,6-dehydratase [Desulfobacterales bacterium]
AELGLRIAWEGQGAAEQGLAAGRAIVKIDPRYYRPTEVDTLLGDPGRAKEKLGWEPKISFRELVSEMVKADLEEARRDDLCQQKGFQVKDYFE